jgi:hypothetical protein
MPTGFATLVSANVNYFGWADEHPRLASWPAQMWDWVTDLLAAGDPFADVKGFWYEDGPVIRPKYLYPLWTIPVEFRGSMALFSFCAVAAYLSTRGRRVCCTLFIIFCYGWGTIYVAVFLMGMLLADFQFDCHPERLQVKRLPQQQQQQATSSQDTTSSALHQRRRDSVLRKICCSLLVIFAFFLFSQPVGGGLEGGVFGESHPPKDRPVVEAGILPLCSIVNGIS